MLVLVLIDVVSFAIAAFIAIVAALIHNRIYMRSILTPHGGKS